MLCFRERERERESPYVFPWTSCSLNCLLTRKQVVKHLALEILPCFAICTRRSSSKIKYTVTEKKRKIIIM